MGSFADAIARISESVTLRTFGIGSYDSDGMLVEGATTETTITGSVQPATQREMQMLPEGRRERETLKIYTTTALKSVSASNGTQADQIDYNGETYEVVTVQRWVQTQAYYRAFLQRIGDG